MITPPIAISLRAGHTAARSVLWCAAAFALACCGSACTHTTVLSTRHTFAHETQPGETHTVIQDESRRATGAFAVDLGATLRMDFDGTTLPVISPDGRHAAVQTACDAPWNVRLGDALPVQGLRTRIEAVSLEAEQLGLPTATLEGNWLLGRAATNTAFLAERPRSDGGRDIALVPWDGGTPTMVAADGWTNAFATVSPSGQLAWCRRPPEGGAWQLVVECGGTRTVLESASGDQWLFPSFAGDGTGIFALRLDQTALSAAWLPFSKDGQLAPRALHAPQHAVPISLIATLQMAAQVTESATGLAASCPGSERLVLYAPNLHRAVTWAPGGLLDPLAEGTIAATLLDDETALVTTRDMLGTQRLGDTEKRVDLIAEGPWLARPTTVAPSVIVAIRPLPGRVELAHIDVRARRPAR